MAKSIDHTTLLCLFHHPDHANAALHDLEQVKIPRDLISVLGGDTDQAAHMSVLRGLAVPQRDLKHLEEALADGGLIVVVKALTEHVDDVEKIFAKHSAEKIDEAEIAAPATPAGNEAAGASMLPGVLPVATAAAGTFGTSPDTLDQDELISQPASSTEEAGTVLLVSENEVVSGEADLALKALEEQSLAPVEVVVVPEPVVREPVRPMQPYSQYRQVD